MIIYKTINLINGKYYIGKSQFNRPEYLGSGVHLNRSIKKYGKKNFKKEILFESDIYDKNILNEKEIFYIDFYDARNPEKGYNITKGGDGGDSEVSKKLWEIKEYRNKIISSLKTSRNTPESKKKTSENSKKMWKDPEIKERIKTSIKKTINTLESKKKRSYIQIKIQNDPNVNKRRSETSKKMWRNLEFKKKRIVQMNTLETKNKQSKSQKKRFEDPNERKKTGEGSRKSFKNPKTKDKQSKSQKKRFEDPNERKKAGKGSKNTCWIKNNKTTESIRINKNDLQKYLNIGWERGRFISKKEITNLCIDRGGKL